MLYTVISYTAFISQLSQSDMKAALTRVCPLCLLHPKVPWGRPPLYSYSGQPVRKGLKPPAYIQHPSDRVHSYGTSPNPNEQRGVKTPPGLLTSAVTGLKTRSTVDTADQRARCNENDTDWGTQLGFFIISVTFTCPRVLVTWLGLDFE